VKAVTAQRGMGRIGSTEDLAGPEIKLIPTSMAQPYEVKLKATSHYSWKVLFINGLNIGLSHTRLIQNNPIRQKFSEAAALGADAVVVTNIFDIETGRSATPLATYKSRVRGTNIKLEVIAKDYQDEARRILRDKPEDELIYLLPDEIFVDLLSGLHKVAVRPDNTPEFPGKVIVVLGWREEQIIKDVAHSHLRYLTILKWHKLGLQIKLAQQETTRLEKADGSDSTTYKKAEAEVQRLLAQQSRSIVSNISKEDDRRHANKMLSFVVRKIEEALPESKVIGLGTSYARFGRQVIEINVPSHLQVTDSLLERFVRRTGPKILREAMAPMTVICHPYALSYRSTIREVDRDGIRGSAQICVAPIVVDDKFLRESIGGMVRIVHPIERAIMNEQFRPGALLLVHHHGNIDVNELPISMKSPAMTPSGTHAHRKHSMHPSWIDEKYIWIMTGTDPHWGGKSKVFLWCEDIGKNGKYLGVAEAVMHLMRRESLFSERRLSQFPLSFFNMNDDGVQGHNFPTQQEHHPNRMSYFEMEKFCDEVLEAAKVSNPATRLLIVKEQTKFFLKQLHLRGEDWTGAQMRELFDCHIEPNLDFFNAVLTHAVGAGLELHGRSHFSGERVDHRDPGFINQGAGNHTDHSVDGELTEGEFYADKIRSLLPGEFGRWKGKRELLAKIVRAPLSGKMFCAHGTVAAPGGYEWGLEFRGSPARMRSWNDPLAGAAANDETRGNYSRIFNGRMTLKTYGDKHFFSDITTPSAIYHMCASGTETDSYGERGFPPNNTGISFIGLPIDGPEYPILRRTIRYDQLLRLLNPRRGQKDRRIDWAEFLPNPV
jgi:hypothetical protein